LRERDVFSEVSNDSKETVFTIQKTHGLCEIHEAEKTDEHKKYYITKRPMVAP
jgi:hypothetical protein